MILYVYLCNLRFAYINTHTPPASGPAKCQIPTLVPFSPAHLKFAPRRYRRLFCYCHSYFCLPNSIKHAHTHNDHHIRLQPLEHCGTLRCHFNITSETPKTPHTHPFSECPPPKRSSNTCRSLRSCTAPSGTSSPNRSWTSTG